jgi:hypothetical protein
MCFSPIFSSMLTSLHSPFLCAYTNSGIAPHRKAYLTGFQRYLENTNSISQTKYKYIQKIHTLILVEWASSPSPQPPKPKGILNNKQSQNTCFTYDVPRRPLNPSYPAGPRRPRSAGRPPPPNSKPCSLTTKGK